MTVLSRSRVAPREGAWAFLAVFEPDLPAAVPARSPWASNGTPLFAAAPVDPPGIFGTFAESWASLAALPAFCPQFPLQPRTGIGTSCTHDGVISRFALKK